MRPSNQVINCGVSRSQRSVLIEVAKHNVVTHECTDGQTRLEKNQHDGGVIFFQSPLQKRQFQT
mgnify:CR=1 FL=1